MKSFHATPNYWSSPSLYYLAHNLQEICFKATNKIFNPIELIKKLIHPLIILLIKIIFVLSKSYILNKPLLFFSQITKNIDNVTMVFIVL